MNEEEEKKMFWLIGAAGKFYQTCLGRAATGDHALAKISYKLDQIFSDYFH